MRKIAFLLQVISLVTALPLYMVIELNQPPKLIKTNAQPLNVAGGSRPFAPAASFPFAE